MGLAKMQTLDLSPRAEAPKADLELVITRIFDAPRELVFKAWSEPDRAMRWWGPQGFTTAHCEMDVRPGGAYRVCMRSPGGTDHCQRGVCREVVAPDRLVLWLVAGGVWREVGEPERLVFSFAWEDAQGRPGHETVVTVSCAEYGAKTKLTLHQAVFETVTARDLAQGGWASALECLAEFLAQG